MARATPGAGGPPPQLVDGRQDQRRQRHDDEQGPRDHRGASSVRHARGRRSTSSIHPQSAVHSLVTFKDGSTLAQLGAARHARADRLRPGLAGADRFQRTAAGPGGLRPARLRAARPAALSRLCRLARLALRQGGAAPTILNAANEVAVAAFIDRPHRLPRHRPDRGARCWTSMPSCRSIGSVDDVARAAIATARVAATGHRRQARRALDSSPSRHEASGMTYRRDHRAVHRSPSCSSCRSSCSSTSSATTWWRGATACGSRPSRSASGPSCSAATTSHGTRWKFSAIPLGGYVKMLGDADATSSTHDLAARPSDPDELSGENACGSAWRSSFAGPAANFIFAIVALAVLFTLSGRPFTPPVVGAVTGRQPGCAAGLLPGDRIVGVGGQPIESFEELQAVVRDSPGAAAGLRHRSRRAADRPWPVTPAMSELTDRFGNVHRVGLIGVSAGGRRVSAGSTRSAAVSEAVAETGRMVGGTLRGAGGDDHRQPRHGRARRPAADRPDVRADRPGRPRAALIWFSRRAVDQPRADQPVPDPDA